MPSGRCIAHSPPFGASGPPSNTPISSCRDTAIDVLISAGRYQDAIRIERPPVIPTGAREAANLCLIQINLAEAEYNLGRWEAARARLHNLELAAWPFPVCRAGLLQQNAWIAAHSGNAELALRLCDEAKPEWLPKAYRAEYHYTVAAARLAASRLREAETAVQTGLSCSIRRSSKRNGLFLRARILAARGDWQTAETLCREASGHDYRGQGGDGLLLWAEALGRLGRTEEAQSALRLAIARDPESAAAERAAAELGEKGHAS